jgi:uncharacterized protein (TIGR03437 family)
MKKPCAKLAILAVVGISSAWSQTSSTGPSASPSSLSFSYTINSTTLPASTKLKVSLPATVSSSTVISVVPVYPAGAAASETGWLSVAPASGASPLTLEVVANPTGLPPGSFTSTLSVTTSPNVGSLNVPVTLSISNPPANLVVTPGATTTNFTPANGSTPATLLFSYTTGAAWSDPASELDVSTNGGIIPFNVTVANATTSGKSTTPVWLQVAPEGTAITSTQTSGVAVAGSDVPIMVSLNQTVVQSLLPGSYGGTVTFAATSTANGTMQVAVNLVVSAGAPSVTSIFPSSIVQAPAVNPLITINGQNFFSTSVVTLAPAGNPANNQCTQNGTPTQVTSSLLSQNIMTATVANAATLFATPGSWCICVTNPAPPNAPNQAPACTPTSPVDYTFYVISNSQVSVSSVLNAASYQQTALQIGTNTDPVTAGQTSIAPDEIVSIFGQNLGPTTPLPATPAASPAILNSSVPLSANLNTLALAPAPLQFTVTSSSSSTPVSVNFASDPNQAAGESLTNIVTYINQMTTSANLGNLASLNTVLGSTYLTITSPTSGSAAGITVTDDTASELFNFTTPGNNVTVNGADMAFPFQLDGIQVAFQFTNTQTSVLTTLYAPIIMVAANQINAMVPSEVISGIGGSGATLVVRNGSNTANFSNLVLVNEDPGIFTLSGEGTGQAAVLNYNPTTGAYTINSSKNTAPQGSTIVIYATGLGILSTPLPDGVAASTADKVTDPVQVTIGGQPSVVTYAGTSPGSIGGLTQINAIVPPTAASGQAVTLTIAGGTAQTARASQTEVTLAVK